MTRARLRRDEVRGEYNFRNSMDYRNDNRGVGGQNSHYS